MMTALLEASAAQRKALGDCCDGCGCGSCSMLTDTSPQITAFSGEHGTLIASVMGYQFDPVIHRMVDKYDWNEAEARQVFEDTKRFLALAATQKESLVPPPKVDDMWHNFILFTEDYAQFCKAHAGRYIHHRPRRRGEVMKSSSGKNPIKVTLAIARSVFGDLSEHWTYPLEKGKADAEAICTCDGNCGCPDPTSMISGVFKQADCDDCAPVACGHR